MRPEYVLGLRCTVCGTFFEDFEALFTCPHCGEKGILDVEYDYLKIKGHFDKMSLSRNRDYTIWRYLPLLPLLGKPKQPLLKVGYTPLYEVKRLGEAYHQQNLFLKDDGVNPTGSLKDRASILAVAKAIEAGKDTICCSSTGNAASSLAGNAAKVGLKTLIFVPERAPKGKLAQLMIYGANLVIVKGDYKAAFNMSKAAIDQYGFYNRNAAINPYLVEGKKTVALEICEQTNFESIDWVIVSVGDGCTIAGVYKGFYDMKSLGMISKIPRILGVQADGCKPLLEAFVSNSDLKESDENTLADSIAVGIPRNPKKALKAVYESKGSYISVTDDEILEAMRILGRTEGVFAEPASGASVAGFIKAKQRGLLADGDRVVIIHTGNGLKDIQSGLKAVTLPEAVDPDTTQLKTIVERMN